MTLRLSGVGVLVTRPRGQSAGLMRRLVEAGARPFSFPALAIFPVTTTELRAIFADLDGFDLAIFVSPTAVEQGLAALGRTWPAAVAAAGIGAGTAQALFRAGVARVIAPPTGADSEHLLALPDLQHMTGKRVLIVRGEGGRELIAEALAARGAEITHAVCYRRGRPDADPAPLHAALATGALQAVTILSSETLDHLLVLAGPSGRNALLALPLFAPHPRVAAHARSLGFVEAIATGHGEDGLVAGLVEYFAHD